VRADLGAGETLIQYPIVPVHEYFAYVSNSPMFGEACFAPEGQVCVSHFWQHVATQPWSIRHPATADQSRLPWTVPAGMFGDDARLYKQDKMIVWELMFPLSMATTTKCTFILAVLPKGYIIPGKTLEDRTSSFDLSPAGGIGKPTQATATLVPRGYHTSMYTGVLWSLSLLRCVFA